MLAQGNLANAEPEAEARAVAVTALAAVVSRLAREPIWPQDFALPAHHCGGQVLAPISVDKWPLPYQYCTSHRQALDVSADPAGSVSCLEKLGQHPAGRWDLQGAAIYPGFVPSSMGGPACAAQVAAFAMGPLLAAINDYTTDKRGDVGSWVREAAMAALAQVSMHRWALCCGL